jgi:hypothetical protein
MVVKRYVGWLGYDVEDFAGHSLRAFVIRVLLPSMLGYLI